MNGVTFSNNSGSFRKHSFNDLGLIMSQRVIAPPKTKTSSVDVPLRDGIIDLTKALSDIPKYENRSIKMTFSVIDPMNTWPSKISEIENMLHGQELRLTFDDDLAFYYKGRLSVNSWTSSKNIGKLVIEGNVDPFKYDQNLSDLDWEWDIFDFEDGIINEMGELIVDGEREITLICRKKREFPHFYADPAHPITLQFQGETHRIAGGCTFYDLFFSEGENKMKFTGNGTVSISYQGGSL